MKVLVTGGTGFIGGHVVDRISEEGHDVLVLTLEKDASRLRTNGVACLCCDLAEFESLRPGIAAFNPDAVVHLAWEGIPDYSERVSMVNLTNSIQLLDFVVEETGCRKIIAAGSCFEYGKEKGVCLESDPVQLTSYFAWAKYSLCRYLLLKCEGGKVELTWFRIFYAYGPGQRGGSLVPTLVQALRHGRAPDIRSPRNKNDFVYVGDIAEAFVLALETPASSGIYNLGSGTATSVHTVCGITEEYVLGGQTISDAVLRDRDEQGTVDFWASTQKLFDNFGWRPRTTLKKGIGRYVASLQ